MMTEAIRCKFVEIFDSVATTGQFVQRPASERVEPSKPIWVDVHVRSHNDAFPGVVTAGDAASGSESLAVGTLLDCYL